MSEPERDPVSAPSQTPGLSTSRKLLFGLLTLVVFYGVLEGFARIAAPVVMGDTYGAPSALDRWEADGWIVDPVLGWSMVPGDSRSRGGATATTNSRGFRGPTSTSRSAMARSGSSRSETPR